MPTLNITVNNKVAKGDDQIIICDNTDYVVHFTFDEEWNGIVTKTMRVLYPDGTYNEYLFEGNESDLPRIYNTHSIAIGVYAGNIRSTTPAVYICRKSVVSDNEGPHADPPTDIYNQIMAAIQAGELKGVGIESIEKTSTEGLVDTYTITYNDESTTTFEITNGNGIDNITKTAEIENVDIYTITFDDGTTTTFQVANANVIADGAYPGMGVGYILDRQTAETGNVVTFETDTELPMPKVVANFTPVQDLHGQTAPYPAGGGKNKFDPQWLIDNGAELQNDGSLLITSTNYTVGLIPITVESGATYQLSYDVKSAETATQFYIAIQYTDNTRSRDVADLTPNTWTHRHITSDPSKTIAGINVTYYSSNRDTYFKNIQLEEGSTATDYAPYSNICPISGWTGCNVYDDSKLGQLVDWNQLISPSYYAPDLTDTWYVRTNNGDGSVTVQILSAPDSAKVILLELNAGGYYVQVPLGHKYLWYDPNPQPTGIMYREAYGGQQSGWNFIQTQANNAGRMLVSIRVSTYVIVGTYTFKPNIFDLTAMFGADNEPSTVEEFKALFPKDYYPYNAGGTMMTVGEVNGEPYRAVNVVFPNISKNLIDPSKKTKHSASQYYWYFEDGFVLKAGTAYALSTNITENTVAVYIRNKSDGTQIVGGHATETYTPTEDKLVYFSIYRASGADEVEIQLEQSNTVTAYQPYFYNTVYGGSLDVAKGVLTAKYKCIDLGDQTWTTAGSGRHNMSKPSDAKRFENAETMTGVCTQYIATSGSGLASHDMSFGMVNGNVIQINDSRLNGEDATTFKTAMSGVYLAYELATPIVYKLSPATVRSLIGLNNVFTDTNGETEVDYYRSLPIDISNAVRFDEAQTKTDDEKAIAQNNIGLGSVLSDIEEIQNGKADNDGTYLEMKVGEVVDQYFEESDSVVSFETDLEMDVAVVANFAPVQDLHGQSSPYPAGGEKNKFDQDTIYASYKQSDGSFIGTAGGVSNTHFNIPQALVGTELTFSMKIKIPSGSSLNNAKVACKVSGTTTYGNNVSSSTYSVSKITFTPTSADDFVFTSFGTGSTENMQFCDVQLEAGSTATDYAPYSNICPITGWTGCNVYRMGFNLFGGTLATGEGYMLATGSYSTNLTSAYASSPIKTNVLGNTTYCISLPDITANATITVHCFDASSNWLGASSAMSITSATKYITYTTPTNARYIGFNVYRGAGYTETELAKCCVNFSDAELNGTYESYKGDTFPVDWTSSAGTVYGGSLDLATGLLKKTWKQTDGGDLNWYKGSGVFWAAGAQILNNAEVMSSQYKWNSTPNVTPSDMADKEISASPYFQEHMVMIKDSAYANATAAEFKTAMSGSRIAFTCVTQNEYQLTPTQIKSLRGKNNVWTDMNGDIALDYHRSVAKVPVPSTTDGSYILKCTVADGKPTYVWVLEET